MLKIAICDDEPAAAKKLEEILRFYGQQKEILMEMYFFQQGKYLLEDFQEYGILYDLIFLDIEMEEMDGLEIAHKIRKENQEVLIIFVTSHTHYAIDSFEVRPFRFLVKPLEEEKVRDCLWKAYEILLREQIYFEFRYFKSYYRISMGEILYFESRKRKIYIHRKDGEIQEFYEKMDILEKELEQIKAVFWRIHKSFLVNSRHVTKKSFDYLELSNGERLSISEDRRKEFHAEYLKQWKERGRCMKS